MDLLQTTVLMAVIGVSPASGWFFGRANTASADDKPVDPDCEAHGEAGRCEFYQCFEERFPCGKDGYMAKFGTPFCARFERVYGAFTPKGQEFVNGTARCLTRGLLQYYKQDKVDCHRLSHDAFDLVSSCYASNGFCDVAEENAAVFTDVFQPKYLFKSGALKIWKEIMELMYHCNPDKVHNLATTVVKMVSGFVNFLTSSGSR
ncbi:hypothetical protein BaRGS_00035364 [Batillaria attramentaria]|uniref:Secreted protein n=1 Tax=Batillaria attramentaria TaxID=370345 RepID=A0ABD0J2F9_9CAEN